MFIERYLLNSYSELLLTIEESRTLAITSLINKLKAEGKNVLSFSAGEPDFNTPEFIKKAARKAIDENFTRYTANEGTPALINAVIKHFEKNGLHYKPENILVSNGAKHSIYNILMAICNEGDEVIYQSPYWVSYPEMVKLCKAKSVVIDAGVEQDYKITSKQLENSITEKTKVFIFNTPSNPTGAVYSENEIRALAEVLVDKNIFIISDEIYERILFDGEKHFSIGTIEKLKDNVITISGVSKSYAMTGWRIGFAAGNKEIIRLARNLQSHSTSNACSIAQAASVAALTEEKDEIEKMVKEFSNRRNFIVSKLNEIKEFKCPNPKGAFYVFFDVSSLFGKKYKEKIIENSTSFCEFLLEEALVGLVPGIAFGNDKCVRMSYACKLDSISEGIERIKTAIKILS